MPFITSLKVTNYCSCLSAKMDLKPFTPLVGYNNAGKSNILEAVNWLLKKSTLDAGKFNDISLPVVVEAQVSGLDQGHLDLLASNHSAALQPYVRDGSIWIRRRQPQPSCSASAIKFEVKDPDDNETWGQPGGIENAIKDIFPEPIIIKAMDDAPGDLSKVSKSNTIGRLISEIMKPIEEAHGEHLRDVLESVGSRLAFDGDNRAPELDEFDQDATDKLQDLFPGLEVKLHIPTPKIDTLFKGGTVKISETGFDGAPKDLESFGHGAQRSVQMALIRQLAEVNRGVNPGARTTLLLIDEPELYLHPQAVESVRRSLANLTEEGYQVIFTTHSAQMVVGRDVASALLVRKNEADGTHVRQRIEQVVSQVIQDSASQVDVLFSLTNSNQILFSEKVILAEGKTERKLLPKVYERLSGFTLAERKIALVEQQGSGNTPKSLNVLQALGIPAKALVDFDFAFKVAVKKGLLDADDSDINACIDRLAVIAGVEGISLSDDGLPRKGGGLSAADGFAKLSLEPSIQDNIKNIHQKLMSKDIWIWTKGAIEDHLGNEAKNEARLAQFAQKIEQEDPRDLLYDFDSVNEFCAWVSG